LNFRFEPVTCSSSPTRSLPTGELSLTSGPGKQGPAAVTANAAATPPNQFPPRALHAKETTPPKSPRHDFRRHVLPASATAPARTLVPLRPRWPGKPMLPVVLSCWPSSWFECNVIVRFLWISVLRWAAQSQSSGTGSVLGDFCEVYIFLSSICYHSVVSPFH
jgi:hypothetical protein